MNSEMSWPDAEGGSLEDDPLGTGEASRELSDNGEAWPPCVALSNFRASGEAALL